MLAEQLGRRAIGGLLFYSIHHLSCCTRSRPVKARNGQRRDPWKVLPRLKTQSVLVSHVPQRVRSLCHGSDIIDNPWYR